MRWGGWSGLLLAALVAAGCGTPGIAWPMAQASSLPRISQAPEFLLTSRPGARLSLGDLRRQVVAVTFLYTTCTDTCPLLTAKMAGVQDRLGQDFGSRVQFVSITVDPARDTPEVLERYARAHRAKAEGWTFLTGSDEEIRDVTGRYGVFARMTMRGDVDHTFLTSLVDGEGILRVQYLGYRFDPDELLRDLRSLLREGGR